MNRRCAAAVLAALLTAAAGAARAAWEDYRPATLAGIIARERVAVGTEANLYTAGMPYRVTVRYTGVFRPLSPELRGFIAEWLEHNKLDPAYRRLFTKAMLVREGDRRYWLPVQSQLIPALEREVDHGAAVTLYVVWAGTAGGEWIFLVNEFRAE